jgi:hypothetical protein
LAAGLEVNEEYAPTALLPPLLAGDGGSRLRQHVRQTSSYIKQQRGKGGDERE